MAEDRGLSPAARAEGALLGLACGDALGAQVEFRSRGTFPRQTELVGGGPHRLEPGEWTDDTSMAYALGCSLLASDDWDWRDTVGRWLDWREDGAYSPSERCVDVGARTATALSALADGREPPLDVYAEGNGSLMRVLPVALRWWREPERAVQVARQQSALTHGPLAADCCEDFVRLVCRQMGGEDALSREALLESYPRITVRRRRAVSSAGRAVDTLQAAIWTMSRARSAEDAVVRAVGLGDDADTVGAVTGALAGARWGAGALPARWLSRLAWSRELRAMARRLELAGEAA